MGNHRAVYRGYAIFVFGAIGAWSFRIESLHPDLPILANPLSDGHASRGLALWAAKRQIDRGLSL